MRVRPELLASAVNGAIVLLLPAAIVAVRLSTAPDITDTSVTVRPPFSSGVVAIVRTTMGAATFMVPLALVAAWRTWVHARRWRDGTGTGWQGVAEAGLLGLALAVLILLPAIVQRPLAAPPFVMIYGGVALVAGLLIGLLLRSTAMIVLLLGGERGRRRKDARAPPPGI